MSTPMTTPEAAAYLGISASLLEKWRGMTPQPGPVSRKVAGTPGKRGGRVVYLREDLDAYRERCASA